MADIVPSAVRSRMMSGIRNRDTKPEMVIRRMLHRAGFRYRLHDRTLPGCPDLVLPRRKAVVFVHGCFWHGHDCHLFRLPATRTGFWRDKIAANVRRDQSAMADLARMGWRIGTVWECAIRGKTRLSAETVQTRLTAWLLSDERAIELRGTA
ncbi:very short patch repair endonuclease [Oceaniradius stylonematis]|uniref:very short patch repair endonuclease n=1 Tax=Oceaniradius stylonematis TaxID=2184161 RepID=UPI003C7D56CE